MCITEQFCTSIDYTPNDNQDYIFRSDTRSLPVRTQLVTDRAGEGIEHFMICLPTQSQLDSQDQGAMVTSPRCVNVTIIDDDCKYIIQFHLASTNSLLLSI